MAKRGKQYRGAAIYLEGMDEWLNALEKMGKNMEAAAVECVDAAQDIVLEDQRERLERHRRTGDAVRALQKKPVKRKGTEFSGEVGTFTKSRQDKNFAGFLHSRMQEYGTPTFPADPWLRPSVEENGGRIRGKWREILKRWGVPVE